MFLSGKSFCLVVFLLNFCCVGCSRNTWVICVMLDLVFVVFIDDVVVVIHTFCCCCVYIVKGDILMPRKLVVVCSGG